MRDYAETVQAMRYAFEQPCYDCVLGEKCNWGDFCFFKRAADAIEELICEVADEHNQRLDAEEKIPQWVSVEDAPKDRRNIFVCRGQSDFKAVCVGHYDPELKLYYEDRNWFAKPIYDAMFWCEMPRLPLPSAPEENT